MQTRFFHHKFGKRPFQFILIYFSLIVKTFFAYINHAPICSWNQPVLSNECKVSSSRKQREPLMGFKLTTERLSQTLDQLRHAAHLV